MSAGLLSVQTDLKCLGGVRVMDADFVSCLYGESKDNTRGAVVKVERRNTTLLSALTMASVLYVHNEVNEEREYFISNLQDDRTSPTATVTAKPVELLISRALVRGLNKGRYSTAIVGTYSIADWISQFIIPSLALAGQTFWTAGITNLSGNYTANFTDQTCMYLVRQLQTRKSPVFRARRNGNIGYYFDIVDLSVAYTPIADVGNNVVALSREFDDSQQANIIVPAGMQFNGNDEPDRIWFIPWLVVTVAGLALTLSDPSAQNTEIVGTDGQPLISGMRWRLACIPPMVYWKGDPTFAANYGLYRALYIQSSKRLWGAFGFGAGVGISSLDLVARTQGTLLTTSLTTPRDLYYYAGTDTLYVVDLGGNQVTPYVTAGPTAGTPIAVGTGPRRCLWVSDGGLNMLLIGHTGSNSILQIDPTSNTVSATSPAMNHPAHMGCVSKTQVYAASDNTGNVYRYQAVTNALTSTIPVAGAVFGFGSAVYIPASSEFWACEHTGSTATRIAIIDTATDTVKAYISHAPVHGAITDCLTLNGLFYGVTEDGLFVCYDGTTHAAVFIQRHAAWASTVKLRSIVYLADLDCFAIGSDSCGLVFMDAQNGSAMVARALTAASKSGGPNLCLQSEALGTSPWGISSSGTVTPNTSLAPDGTTTMDTITRVSGATDGVYQTVTFTGNGQKVISCFLRHGVGSSTDFILYDATAGAALAQVRAAWTGSVLTGVSLVGGTGTVAMLDLGGGLYRISVVATTLIAAHTNQIIIYPGLVGANADTAIVWGVQAEDDATLSAYQPTTSTLPTSTVSGVTLANSTFPVQAGDEVAFCRDDADPLVEIPDDVSISEYGVKTRSVSNPQLIGGTNRCINGELVFYDSSRQSARHLNAITADGSTDLLWDGYGADTAQTFTCAINTTATVASPPAPQSIVLKTAGAGRIFQVGDILQNNTHSNNNFLILAKAVADGSGNVTVWAISNSSSATTLANDACTVYRPDLATMSAASHWVALPSASINGLQPGLNELFADIAVPYIPGEMANLYWGIDAVTWGPNSQPSGWRVRILGADHKNVLLSAFPNPDATVGALTSLPVAISFADQFPLNLNFAGGHLQYQLGASGETRLNTLYVKRIWTQVGNASRGAPSTLSAWQLWQMAQDARVARAQPTVNYVVRVREDDRTKPFVLGAQVALKDAPRGVYATPTIVDIERTLTKEGGQIVQPTLVLDNRPQSLINNLLLNTSASQ